MVQASTSEAPQGTSQSNQKNVKLVIGELTSIKPKKRRKKIIKLVIG
jgi:N-acetylmuramoyl-L-alanine amidase